MLEYVYTWLILQLCGCFGPNKTLEPSLAHSEMLFRPTVMLDAEVMKTPPALARMVPIPTMVLRSTEQCRAWVVSLPVAVTMQPVSGTHAYHRPSLTHCNKKEFGGY